MSYAQSRRRKRVKLISFSEEEWAQVQDNFRQNNTEHRYRNITDFIRSTLVHGSITQIKTVLDPRIVRRDMHNIGININQIAYMVNTTRSVKPEQIDAVQAQVQQLQDQFDQWESIWKNAIRTTK